MNLRKQLLTNNDCYKAGRKITPKGVMVHSTGANNPKVSRYVPGDAVTGRNTAGNHWNKSGTGKCVHAFIGKFADGSVGTVQTLPWNWRGWHCGKSGNNTHISFEICEDGLTDASYFAAVYREAVELTAMLCKEYHLDPLKDGVVICHSEGAKRGIASNHADVLHWFPKHGKDMNAFRADVKEAMGGTITKEENTVEVSLTILKNGSKGESVKALQILLNAYGYSCGTADGIFGKNTETAVKKFQTKNKLSVDGCVGAQTWRSLLGV